MRRFTFSLIAVGAGSLASLATTPHPALAEPTKAVAQASPSPSASASPSDAISEMKNEIQEIQAKLDLLEAQQEQQAKLAADAATQQADLAAKAKSTSGVHIIETAGTDVRLYGLIEPTILTSTAASKSGASTIGIPVSWFSGNRWGLDINQKLYTPDGKPEAPNKLSLIAKLESEFELASGNMDTPGVLFNRDAWLGFQSKTFGKLTIGRQDTLPRDVAGNWGDPYGTAALTTNEGNFTNVNNFKQLIFYMSGGNGAGGQGDTRYDAGIVYKKLFDSGLFVSAAYNFGDQNGPGGPNGSGPIPGGYFNHGSSAAVGIGFNAGRFHPDAFYNTTNVLAAATIGTTNLGVQDQSFGIGGNYDWGIFRLNGGFINYTGDQGVLGHRYDKAWTVSGKFAPSKRVDYELGLQEFYTQNAAINASGYVLRPFVDTSASTATISGTRFTAYGSILVHPISNVDVYLAGDDLFTGGGYLDGRASGFKHQVEAASGLRYKF